MFQIADVSHLDHGLTEDHKAWILAQFGERDGFFIETVQLPETLSPLSSGLHGPIVGDAPVDETDVTYKVRGDRPGPSRLVARASRSTRTMTVIAGPHEGNTCVLFTAYGGPCAEREWWDPSLKPHEAMRAAEFWSQHALSG